MHVDNNFEIGIDGLNSGPFPKPENLGDRLSQWILLPRAEEFGFTQEELVAILGDWLKLCEGSLEESIGKARQLIIAQFYDAFSKMTKAVPKSETVQDVTANSSIKRRRIKSEGERVAEVLALFSALFAYISCIEREGPDRANTYSFLVHETLSMELPSYVVRIQELLTIFKRESPGAFLKRLKKYPSCALVILGRFEGGSPIGLIERPMECLECPFFVAATSKGKGWIKECSQCPSRYKLFRKGCVIAGRTPKLGQGDSPNLYDAGNYLESIMVSLLVGREDFVSKGVNLNIAQQEGLAVMDDRYAELDGEQWIAESLAQGYLDERSQYIIKASLLDGEAFRRAEDALDTLHIMMTRFKKESTEELKKVEALCKLEPTISLGKAIEGEDGEITTLADMMPASPDLEEVMPQLLEICEKLNSDDAKLFQERWIDGKSIDEIAIKQDWKYDRAQKRLWRIEKQIKEILTKTTQ